VKSNENIQLLLADDDRDDCLFFEEALEELRVSAQLITVHDGEELMQLLLTKNRKLPTALFLDLNLPRKNGIECLTEIKNNKKLRDLLVIVYSTSSDQMTLDLLYEIGAYHFIHKPAEFSKLRTKIKNAFIAIHKNLVAGSAAVVGQPAKSNFVLTADL
jgi:response regulator RpfG family c-di-GMP phosphodiesterase